MIIFADSMYTLEKNADHPVLKICFENALSESFNDILNEYEAESGLKAQTVDFLYNYKFIENGKKIQLYWNGGFTVYIFPVEKEIYQTVYERLVRITARLNKRQR